MKSLQCYNKNYDWLYITPLDHNSKKDWQDFVKVFNNTKVMKTVSLYNSKTPTLELLKSDFKKRTYFYKEYNLGSYKIYTAKTKELIGITSLLLTSLDDRGRPQILEFEYFILPKFQGKKIGTDILNCVVSHAFNNFKSVKEVQATALTDNFASQIIMHKVGFKYLNKCKRKTGSTVNLRSINRIRFSLFKIPFFKKSSKYYFNKIQKINKNSILSQNFYG